MPQDLIRELLDLSAVSRFYMSLLQAALGHAVPVPHEVMHAQEQKTAAEDLAAQSVSTLRRWLNLLDLAITPPMLRDWLHKGEPAETAQALLRHFVLKRSPVDADRDKADFVATFLFRARGETPRLAPAPGDSFAASDTGPRFEQEIRRIMSDLQVPLLPEERRQLVREFDFIRQEIEDFRHFDQLMDSGVMQRVREMKHSFADSFYHPRVLATFAEYNVGFGQRFDELFRKAARDIKAFASSVQQQGGSIMSRVEGDIIVKHLTEVQENEILQKEYGRAQEQFRKVSTLKKAVDSRRFKPAVAQMPPPPPSAAVPMRAAAAPPRVEEQHLDMNIPQRAIAHTIEEGKIRAMQDSVRNFVKAADPGCAQVVPLRNGNLTLSSAEVDAFRSDFAEEKSFRSEYAAALMRLVAVQARMLLELDEFKAKQESAYLWKPHADSLAYLLGTAQRACDDTAKVVGTAAQRGLMEKVSAINASVQKVHVQMQMVAKTLQGLDLGNGK